MNSVHAATTSGPPTAVIGLSLKLNAYATSDATPTAISTGHEREQRADDAAQPDGQEEEHEEDREVGELDAVRLEVVEQADADDREARRRGPDPGRRVGVVAQRPDDRGAGVERPGPVRKMMLNARPSPALTVDDLMSGGATS